MLETGQSRQLMVDVRFAVFAERNLGVCLEFEVHVDVDQIISLLEIESSDI